MMTRTDWFGWLYKRPYRRPKKCRWCDGPYVVIGQVVACRNCDRSEGWAGARTD